MVFYTKPFSEIGLAQIGAARQSLMSEIAPGGRLTHDDGLLHARLMALQGRLVIRAASSPSTPLEFDVSRRGGAARMLYTPRRACSSGWIHDV